MITTEALEKIDQGTILKGIKHPSMAALQISVALNPTCLFHNAKADSVILAYLIPAAYILARNEEFNQQIEVLEEKVRKGSQDVSKSKSERLRKLVGKLIDNDEPRRHFYLKGIESIGLPDCFVDFQQITSVPYEFVVQNTSIIGRLSTPWREKLASHYAGYMMRIGVDRFEGECREQIISNMIAPIQLTPAT